MGYGDKLSKQDYRVDIKSTAYRYSSEYRMVSSWIDTDNECWSEPFDNEEQGYGNLNK
jgi:hypothetical protein